MPRLQRLTDFIARLLGKEWDVRALEDRQQGRTRSHPVVPERDGAVGRSKAAGPTDPVRATGSTGPSTGPAQTPGSPDAPPSTGSADSTDPSGTATTTASADTADAGRSHSAESGHSSPSGLVGSTSGEETGEKAEPLTLFRIESMLTGPMEYNVQLADDREHPCLLGTWDSFPFVIEIPEGHDGWLLVSGDWEEAAPVSQRDEIAASVNDWNRDKFFPTVGVVDTPIGPLVRATYLTDLSAGATDSQLRLHLDTALSACTQALSLVGPLLPEI